MEHPMTIEAVKVCGEEMFRFTLTTTNFQEVATLAAWAYGKLAHNEVVDFLTKWDTPHSEDIIELVNACMSTGVPM